MTARASPRVLATPGGVRLGVAGACHLGVLAALAVYLMAYYPGGRPAVLALLMAAVVSETCPPPWKRWLFGELMLVAAGVTSYGLLVDLGGDSFQAWVRMLLAYWLLVPSRPGLLRWGLSLVVAELLILGADPSRYRDLSLGRWPLVGRLNIPTPLLWLAPIGLASLGLDAWLRGLGAARQLRPTETHRQAARRWAMGPALVVAAILVLLGPALLPLTPKLKPHVGGPAIAGVKRPLIRPGESQWVIKDPTPKARMLWEDPDQPQVRGMAYLRIFTLPHITLEDEFISWGAEDINLLRDVDNRFDPNQRFAWVVRRPLGNDAVLCGDGSVGVELNNLLGDRHGNRFLPGMDETPRAYRVNLDPAPDQDADELPEWSEVPAALGRLPWAQIEDPAWKDLSAGDAAEAVRLFLESRCTYDLEDLPTPAPGPGGVMLTFLFGDAAQRRGHCQYFATAASLLLRRMGHPTRCVAGFASDEQDGEGYVFRGLNAHAWLEVRDSAGAWLRLDPTPAQHLRSEGVPLSDPTAPPGTGKAEITQYQGEKAEPEGPPSHLWWLVLLPPLAALLLLRRRRGPLIDARQAELDRHSGNLVRLASQLGVPVAPHTTLSEIARRLSDRTGIDLSRHLDAHLAARFGNGPLPPPWPLAELRAADAGRARERASARR